MLSYVAVRPCICSEPPLNFSTTLSRSSMRQWCYNTKGHTSRQRRKHWLLPSSVSWSRDRHPRCDAATGANVPEGEKHDRDPTGAIHDGSPLAPLRDGEVDFPAVPQHQVPTIQTIQRRSRLLKSSSLVDESMPREWQRPEIPEDPQGC